MCTSSLPYSEGILPSTGENEFCSTLSRLQIEKAESFETEECTTDTNSSSDSSSSGDSRQSHVRFSSVDVREYPFVLGDHPGVEKGAPLAIDWEPCSSNSISLEDYEASRKGQHQWVSRISWQERNVLLRELGLPQEAIKRAEKAAAKVRQQRQESRVKSRRLRLLDAMESLQRKLENFKTGGEMKKKEREYLETHVPNFGTKKGSITNSQYRSLRHVCRKLRTSPIKN